MRYALLLAVALAAPLASAQSVLDQLSGTPGFERSAPPPVAERAPTPGGTAPSPGNGPAQVPIDGGLGLLAAAGAGYAAKKLRDRRRA